MNDRTEALVKSFYPSLAVIVYTNDIDSRQGYYLESHEIDKEGKLLEGKPLKQETIQGMVDVFFDDQQQRSIVSGIFPENLLSFEMLPGGHYKMAWYRPEEERQLFFSKDLHINSGKAWVPALLYVVDREELAVLAMINNSRPGPNAQLYRAPFHNVDSGGDVCLGNAKIKKPEKKTFENIIKYWEDIFWLSEFSHLNGLDNPTVTNVNLLWKKLIGTDIKWSAMQELVPVEKLTTKDIIK